MDNQKPICGCFLETGFNHNMTYSSYRNLARYRLKLLGQGNLVHAGKVYDLMKPCPKGEDAFMRPEYLQTKATYHG